MAENDSNLMTEPPLGPTALSNSIRLTVREWLCVALVTVVFVILAPALWQQAEAFTLEPDYRMPHDLSNDYWLYQRYAAMAADNYDTLLLGDSVVWGEYVTRQKTLPHYLNELSGTERHANLGLDGAHPLALSGLAEHYAGSVAGKNVLVVCNPLWLSSPKQDLQDDKTTEFNHPRLVPQFIPAIPSYQEQISNRIGVFVEQRLEFNKWTNHLQQAYYDRSDIPSWTLEHPYDNPLEPLTSGLPASDNALRHLPQPWYKSGITKQDYPWVELETSLQWRAFQRVVEILQRRGNRVLVLIGPFNEHMLTAASLERYQRIKRGIATWLETKQVPHMVPPPLPSALYGDASHPLAAGYENLARQILRDPALREIRAARVTQEANESMTGTGR